MTQVPPALDLFRKAVRGPDARPMQAGSDGRNLATVAAGEWHRSHPYDPARDPALYGCPYCLQRPGCRCRLLAGVRRGELAADFHPERKAIARRALTGHRFHRS